MHVLGLEAASTKVGSGTEHNTILIFLVNINIHVPCNIDIPCNFNNYSFPCNFPSFNIPIPIPSVILLFL